MESTRKRGNDAEKLACQYLLKQQLELVQKNFYCRYGEIDLIMLDQQILVFIEVRHRNNQLFMQTIESIDNKKQQKIILTSQFFLQSNKHMNKYDLRFDVVTVNNSVGHVEIDWLKNAFQT